MSDTPTRRQVLKATAATGAVGIVASQANAAPTQTIRTIEAGLRYDLDIQDNFSWVRLDSRPQFTINDRRKELVFANRVSQARVSEVRESGTLFAEQPVQAGQSTPVSPGDNQVRTLPTDLSARMRPMEGVSLSSPHRLPRVDIHQSGTAPRVVIPSETTVDLKPGTNREIRLDPRTVEVTTVTITDEKVPIEGRPEHRWGPRREYDSVEVEATPIVEVVDHGELTLRRRKLA